MCSLAGAACEARRRQRARPPAARTGRAGSPKQRPAPYARGAARARRGAGQRGPSAPTRRCAPAQAERSPPGVDEKAPRCAPAQAAAMVTTTAARAAMTDLPGRRSRIRERNILLNPLPVVSAALATFGVIFVLLAARPTAGKHVVLALSPTTVSEGSRHTTLRTATSAAATEGQRGASARSPIAAAPLATRSSPGGTRDD